MQLEFTHDPAAFLDVAGALLTADPLLGTVVAGVTQRAADARRRGIDPWSGRELPYRPWWVTVRDGAGDVVGAGMRTAPFAPWPAYLLPMADATAVDLARVVHDRGEEMLAVNGALPSARVCAEEMARLVGGRAAVSEHQRLHEATEAIVPEPPPGALRAARTDEVALCRRWFTAFGRDADEMAGREPGSMHDTSETGEEMLRRIAEGRVWVWEAPSGEVVHLSGVGPPAYGVSRIGPVYTPAEHRGRGLASYVVAELTRRGLAQRHRMCLFTDQANPTSNAIYAAVGYRPVVDTAVVAVTASSG